MSKSFYKYLTIVISIVSVFSIVAFLMQSVEVSHLNKENAKFINEIEYLKGSNDSLQEDNQDMQGRIWNLYNNEMKGSK